MKTSTVIRNGVTPQVIELVARLVDMIPWPVRRSAMGDVIISLLTVNRELRKMYLVGAGALQRWE